MNGEGEAVGRQHRVDNIERGLSEEGAGVML